MEIDITALVLGDTWELSGSRATHGDNAGPMTWAAARAAALNEASCLATEDELDAFRDHVAGFGAWDRDEIAGWDATYCNALFLQFVAGDKREGGLDEVETMQDEAWDEYEANAAEGGCSGRISRGWSRRLLCETATAHGWTNYLGSFYHPILNHWSGAAPTSAAMACDVSGVFDGLPHDAAYYYLGD